MAEKIKITNGTYKEDDPHKEIGYQKWRVRKTHEVIMEYEIVAKTKQEADELLEKNECINVEKIEILSKLPSLEEARAKLIGLLTAPAQKIARIITVPSGDLARVFNAYVSK